MKGVACITPLAVSIVAALLAVRWALQVGRQCRGKCNEVNVGFWIGGMCAQWCARCMRAVCCAGGERGKQGNVGGTITCEGCSCPVRERRAWQCASPAGTLLRPSRILLCILYTPRSQCTACNSMGTVGWRVGQNDSILLVDNC